MYVHRAAGFVPTTESLQKRVNFPVPTVAGPFSSTSRRVASWPSEDWFPQMIVFDKDGTLGDCTQALRVWCTGMTERIRSKCSTSNFSQEKTDWIVSSFHAVIGWSSEKSDVMPSAPLSAGTWSDILDITHECLLNAGVSVSIDEVNYWHEHLGDIHAEDPPLIKDLADFLQYFRRHGIIISICTSDDRSSTNACLRHWQIEELVDYSVCGDEVTIGKPSPMPLFQLCKQAGLLPRDCMIVGDTSSDTGMGINAGAGLVVGVLTGSGTKKQLLDTGAHIVLPSIASLQDLLSSSIPSTRAVISPLTAAAISTESFYIMIKDEKKEEEEEYSLSQSQAAAVLTSMASAEARKDFLKKKKEEEIHDDQDDLMF